MAKKRPSVKDITTPTKKTPVKEKQAEAQSVEEMRAELAEFRKEKKARGGRPKKEVKERASVRVSFYITPTQKTNIDELDERGSVSVIAKRHLLGLLNEESEDENE